MIYALAYVGVIALAVTFTKLVYDRAAMTASPPSKETE